MRQTILQKSIFLLMLVLSFQSQAQVTITQNDYPRPANFTDSLRYTDQTGVAVPSEGADQVWDYTSLQAGEFRTQTHFDASNEADFPGALNYYDNDLIFQGFEIQSNTFETIDADGWYNPGRSIEDVTYSITAISGGPTDSLRFVGGNYNYDGRLDLLKFPLNYQDQWTETSIRYINFEISIAAFGLNQVPGFRKRYFTNSREVVGHGSLTIPDDNGMPTEPMDVLLIKVERTATDSFFLGGAPAPAALLTAFGLAQGTVSPNNFYVFYRPGFGAPVMDIGLIDDNTVDDVFYRPKAADISTSIFEIATAKAISTPNPIAAGAQLSIQLNSTTTAGSVSFYNLSGKQVFSLPFESASGQSIQVDLPKHTTRGMYFYHVLDEKGLPVGFGKLQVF